MALINCPQCGHMISDKAKACPKCGYVLNNEQAKPVENIDDEESESQFDDCTPQQGGGLKWILIVLAILVIGGGVGYYFYADNKAKKEIALAAEQARLDSIEAARLDSLRQDSIARRNFTSPDLEFHGLHGDVKKYVLDDYATYTFDENGKWTNEPQWSEYDKEHWPEKTKHPRVIRDNNGYIIRIYNDCDADDEYEAFSWEGDKVIEEGANVEDEHGFTIYDEFEGWCGKYPSTQTVYYDYIVDDMGNWIQRSYFLKSWDPDYPDFTTWLERTETRTITYYKKISQNRTALPNSSFQKQKLQALKASKQKKEQEDKKGPEWLQGSWELTIDSPYGVIATYYLTINGQNAHLVEGDTDKYNGRYEIRDGYIIVGPRKYYINDNYQRLDYNQYRWHKISGGNSRQVNSGRSSSFGSANDVMRYLSGRTFYNDGDGLRIDYNAVYLNGRALTGAPRVVDISGNSATVVANSPYSGGGALRFYVNSSNGTVTQNGDVYRER